MEFGPDNPNALASRDLLAVACESLGRWPDAAALRRNTLGRRRKAEKPDSPFLAVDLAMLGSNLLKQAKRSDAEPVLRECLAIRAKAVPDDWSRFSAISLLGGTLLGQGRYTEAEPLIVDGYRVVMNLESKITHAGKPRLSDAAERVVQRYEAWGKLEQAAARKLKLRLADLPADVFA